MSERNVSKGGLIIGGLISLLFGILILAIPTISLLTFVTLFAIFAIIYGLGMVVSAVTREEGDTSRMPLIVGGLLSILVGIAAFIWPNLTLLILVYIIAFRALVVGAAEIYASYQIRRAANNEILLGIVGFVNIILGLFLIFSPAIGFFLLLLVLGWYAIIVGIAYIIEGFMLPTGRSRGVTAH